MGRYCWPVLGSLFQLPGKCQVAADQKSLKIVESHAAW